MSSPPDQAYVLTGPTSGIGYRTALLLAKQGTVVLVARDREKLDEVKRTIEQQGGHACCIACDLSDLASVQQAARDISALGLTIVGLINNAGVQQPRVTKNRQGWDMSFATNHLGPFALTEALLPRLSQNARVLFVGSATEDPERKPARAAGFRGGRYISARASAQGQWAPGGSSVPGQDAYATSKQCNIATALALAREKPQLRINAIEPGFIPSSGLHRHVSGFPGFLMHHVLPLLTPFMKYWSTTQRAAQVITTLMADSTVPSGTYFDERGIPMQASTQVRDPVFQDRVLAETRAFLAAAPA